MNKVFIAASLACVVCLGGMLTIYAQENVQSKSDTGMSSQQETWSDDLENSLYTQLPVGLRSTRGVSSQDNDAVLMGSTIDFSTVAQLYASELDLSDPEGYNDFINTVSGGQKVKDLCEPTNLYFATVSGPADPIPGTAILQTEGSNVIVQQVIEADRGELYQVNLSTPMKSTLTRSSMKMDQSGATLIALEGYMQGVLITDGTEEYVLVTSSVRDIIPANSLLSIDELLENMKQHKDVIVTPVNPDSVDENGKYNPMVG